MHGGQTQSEQIASSLQKEKTEAENGNLTTITPQISGVLDISGFLSPNFIIYPLGSTALFLHQNYYKLLNQDYGDLYQLGTDKQGKQRNYSVERFSYEVILNSSGILVMVFNLSYGKSCQLPPRMRVVRKALSSVNSLEKKIWTQWPVFICHQKTLCYF